MFSTAVETFLANIEKNQKKTEKKPPKHERPSNITLRHKLKELLIVRKDMDENKHEIINKLKYRNSVFIALLRFTTFFVCTYEYIWFVKYPW
jgi:hypothetical protein